MECDRILNIKVERHEKPCIYLDTNAMLELAKHERGSCAGAHKQEIGELYDMLTALTRENRILCPLGNQMQEMGMTAKRKTARLFLYRFTNCELLHPDLIFTAQMQAGYRAFYNTEASINLGIHTAFEQNKYPGSQFVIHADPVYSPEKAKELREEKHHIEAVLNAMKANGEIKANFTEQLRAELESEYISFLSALAEPMASEKACMRYMEEIGKFHRITGFSPTTEAEQHINHLASYTEFLISPYHDVLPYIWIRANLWSHLMHREKAVLHSDNLDIQWAAAYLPFIDYAVTDNACCQLLQDSGMAELYGTKVYSFKTLASLLTELEHLKNSQI